MVAPVAMADPERKSPQTTEKTPPKSDQSETDKSAKPEKIEDLDAFFEKGERQSEEGPSCRPKTKPIA